MNETDNLELIPILLYEVVLENKLPVNRWLTIRIKNICLNVIGYYIANSNVTITEYLKSEYFKTVYTDIESLTDYREYTLDLLSKFSFEFSTKYDGIRTAVFCEIKDLITDLKDKLSPIEYTVFMSTYIEKCKRYHWHW